MEKSITTSEHVRFTETLRQLRLEASLTQTEIAGLIGETQSFVSKVERGELRVDLVQLRTICRAMKIDLIQFVQRFEDDLAKERRKNR